MAGQREKKKILIVIPTLECGGLERNVSLLCNTIDTEKYAVTLAVLNNANPFFPISNSQITVIDMGIKNVRKSLPALIKLTKKIRPAVIFTTANHLNLLFAIFRWIFPANIRIIARESSIVSINSRQAKLPVLYNSLLKFFYKNLDLIICQSEYMRNDLVKHYKVPVNKTAIIYNAVTIPETIAGAAPSPFAELITVARLSKEKGLDRLIRAVSLLKIPYRFTIIGEGEMHTELQQLIETLSLQHRVFLAGSHSLPFTVVPRADLFLMGSWYEGFPNAMLEALAAGIPVISFNSPGGIAELLVNKENGFLIEGNDEAGFADAITKALNHPFNRENIKSTTLERFNVKAIIEQWDKAFE